MRKVLVLTRYGMLGASSRVRILQFIPDLSSNTIFEVSPFFSDEILEDLYKGKGRNILLLIKRYFIRLMILFRQNEFDYLWIEKELFPYIPGWLESVFIKKNTNYFLDYDDAIFHNYELSPNIFLRYLFKNKLKPLIRNANKIFVGNNYLYDYVSKWNPKVDHLYSVVNEQRYIKNRVKTNSEEIVIGWIGSPSTTKYLDIVLGVLNRTSNKFNIRLITVGAKKLPLQQFPITQLDWNLKSEIDDVYKFDIGIMPLYETSWENGKCGYKLIQYMASGIPVIASPVGINKEIVIKSVGFLATNEKEWEIALTKLLESVQLREELGINSRKLIEEKFSFSRNLEVLKNLFE